MDNKTDPVIIELLKWLKDNLPPDVDEAEIFKKVRRVQKVFDTLIGLSFEEFYNHAMSIQQSQKEDDQTFTTLEDAVSDKLDEMKDYISLNEEKLVKTKKLNGSRAKLDLKREQYQLISSIRLDGCMDLISRYNHLMGKK